MGSIGGIPEEGADKETGFNDPRTDAELSDDPKSLKVRGGMTKQIFDKDGKGLEYENEEKGKTYPKDDSKKESDTNRLARNELIDDTIVKLKKDEIDKDVPTADITCKAVRAGLSSKTTSSTSPKKEWSEPETKYNAVYPVSYTHLTLPTKRIV